MFFKKTKQTHCSVFLLLQPHPYDPSHLRGRQQVNETMKAMINGALTPAFTMATGKHRAAPRLNQAAFISQTGETEGRNMDSDCPQFSELTDAHRALRSYQFIIY